MVSIQVLELLCQWPTGIMAPPPVSSLDRHSAVVIHPTGAQLNPTIKELLISLGSAVLLIPMQGLQSFQLVRSTVSYSSHQIMN